MPTCRSHCRGKLIQLALHAPSAILLSISGAVLVAMVCRIGVTYSFNVNEGWNAYWAAAAWQGADLYPPPSSLKLNTYLPLWFYATGWLGSVVGDNILAGRIVAGSALLLDAVVIFRIAREITGHGRDGWCAAAAFLAMNGLYHAEYVGANDPQWAANLLMSVCLLAMVREINGKSPGKPYFYLNYLVPLLLVGGMAKHNVIAAPASIAIFLLLYRRAQFVLFAVYSAVGLLVVCAALYAIFGTSIFASLLFPRQYDFANAWAQTIDHLRAYGPLLLITAYLAWQTNPPARLIFIYSIVSLAQGLVLSGGLDVDVNVFFDFAIATSIGLGLLQNSVFRTIRDHAGRWQAAAVLALWLAIPLTPVALVLPQAIGEARDSFETLAASPQQADVAYLKAAPNGAICENAALCYWAGKPFQVDLNNLKILMTASARLEAEFIAHLGDCSYPLIQLNDDWDDVDEGPFTAGVIAALKEHYVGVRNTAERYWKPHADCGAAER
jgi:hypothetical protein